MHMNRRQFMATAAVTAASTSMAGAQEGTKLRACVIGDSQHGKYGHHIDQAFAQRADAEIVALADPDEKGRAAQAEQCGAPRTYTDYREMLDKEKPNLVAIGPRWTPNHKDYLLAAAEVGAHGIIEKPLASDLAEADEMVQAIESKNLKWAIAFNVRALPPILHLKRMLLEENLIGTILEMRLRGKEDHRAGGEDLMVLGTHLFDLACFLMDRGPEWCFADVTTNGKPSQPGDVHDPTEPIGPVAGDRIHATYGFGQGVVARFDSMKNPDGNGGRFGLDIYGTRGVVTTRFGTIPPIFWLDDPKWAPTPGGPAWKPIPGAPGPGITEEPHERNRPIIDDLMAAIKEDRRPAVSLQDGRRSLEMVQAVYESHVQGGRVAIPLKERAHPLKRWA